MTPDHALEQVDDERDRSPRCVNCGHCCVGPYCSACGQRQPAGRHTVKGVLRDIGGRIVNVDRGFTHTAIQLTVNPGRVINGYWAGRTVPFANPFTYLVVSVAAFVLILGTITHPIGAADSDRVLVLLAIPCIAIASWALIVWERRNYAEHLIAVTYLCAHVVLSLGVFSIGFAMLSDRVQLVYAAGVFAVAVGYWVWGYSQTFPSRRLLAAVAGLASLVVGGVAWAMALAALVSWLRG